MRRKKREGSESPIIIQGIEGGADLLPFPALSEREKKKKRGNMLIAQSPSGGKKRWGSNPTPFPLSSIPAILFEGGEKRGKRRKRNVMECVFLRRSKEKKRKRGGDEKVHC